MSGHSQKQVSQTNFSLDYTNYNVDLNDHLKQNLYP